MDNQEFLKQLEKLFGKLLTEQSAKFDKSLIQFKNDNDKTLAYIKKEIIDKIDESTKYLFEEVDKSKVDKEDLEELKKRVYKIEQKITD